MERNTKSAGLRGSEETGKEALTALAKEYRDALSCWQLYQNAHSTPKTIVESEIAFRAAMAAKRKFDLAMDKYFKSHFP